MRKVEFHCHTNYSLDGLISIVSLFETARRCGLDAVAITDHDTIEGALEARKWSRRGRGQGVEIIVGEERTLADGSHLIGLFLVKSLTADSFEDALEEIADQGGRCLVPHPFRRKDGLLRDSGATILNELGYRGAVEAFNAKVDGRTNNRAQKELGQFSKVVGSDAHYECDLGEAINVIEGKGSLREAVEAVFDGREQARLLVKCQGFGEGERSYAPVYHRFRRFVRLPRAVLPVAKEAYRRYRNLRCGVGPKALVELGEG